MVIFLVCLKISCDTSFFIILTIQAISTSESSDSEGKDMPSGSEGYSDNGSSNTRGKIIGKMRDNFRQTKSNAKIYSQNYSTYTYYVRVMICLAIQYIDFCYHLQQLYGGKKKTKRVLESQECRTKIILEKGNQILFT